MPTNTAFITDALTEIARVGRGKTADSGDLQNALDIQNRMMAQWALSSRDVGYFPQDTLADTIPIPIWAEEAVQANLAVKLASFFRTPITRELAQKAIEGENMVTRTVITSNRKGANMDHLPGGHSRINIITGD